MHAYTSLRDIVNGAGVTLLEEHLQPEVFGSAYAVFKGYGPKFRLVWDGKERYGLLQVEDSLGQWKDQGPLVRERFAGKFSNMPAFMATAVRLSAGAEEK